MPIGDAENHYDMTYKVLDEAWMVITDPPGLALDPDPTRIQWAQTATLIGLGHALLARRYAHVTEEAKGCDRGPV